MYIMNNNYSTYLARNVDLHTYEYTHTVIVLHHISALKNTDQFNSG